MVTVVRSQELEIYEDIQEYDPLRIYTFFTRLGKSSFVMASEAYKRETLIARGTAVLVTVDLTNPLQVMTLPDPFRTEIESILAPPVSCSPMPAEFVPIGKVNTCRFLNP